MDSLDPQSAQLVLTVRLDPASEPISGSLEPPGGQAESFSGWLQLVNAIEIRLEQARRAQPPVPDGR